MINVDHIEGYQSNPVESERVLWVWLLDSPAFDGSIHRMVHPRTGILLAFSQWPDHLLHQIQYWNIGISKLKVFSINSGIKKLNMTKAIWWFCSCEYSNNWDWTSMYYARRNHPREIEKLTWKGLWIYFKLWLSNRSHNNSSQPDDKKKNFLLLVLGPNI